jgi:general secretion pathway protein A
LEQVRLLSNLETEDRKLLQIVLMGQPELRDRLNDPALRQLRQRITVRYHLSPLKRSEIGQYVHHRLAVSGANGTPYFTGPALWRVFCYSKGIPRVSMRCATSVCWPDSSSNATASTTGWSEKLYVN